MAPRRHREERAESALTWTCILLKCGPFPWPSAALGHWSRSSSEQTRTVCFDAGYTRPGGSHSQTGARATALDRAGVSWVRASSGAPGSASAKPLAFTPLQLGEPRVLQGSHTAPGGFASTQHQCRIKKDRHGDVEVRPQTQASPGLRGDSCTPHVVVLSPPGMALVLSWSWCTGTGM